MPMNNAQLKTDLHKNVQVVPVEPNVKSAKTFKLFNAGVSAKSKTGKTTDPTCYAWSFNGERSCKHSKSKSFSRTRPRASVAVGDGSQSALGASGFAFAITWAARRGSPSINTPSSSHARHELWEATHHGSASRSPTQNRTFGTSINCRRPPGRRWPMLRLTGRLVLCSTAGSAGKLVIRRGLRLRSAFASGMLGHSKSQSRCNSCR